MGGTLYHDGALQAARECLLAAVQAHSRAGAGAAGEASRVRVIATLLTMAADHAEVARWTAEVSQLVFGAQPGGADAGPDAAARFSPEVVHTVAACAWNAALLRLRVGDRAGAHTLMTQAARLMQSHPALAAGEVARQMRSTLATV